MITTKKTFVGAFIAFVAFFGMASQASALTMAELNAYIDQGFTAEWIMANVSGSGSNSGSNDGSATCGTTTYGYTATSTLKQGMSGASVSALQSALNNYANASLSTDGSFGPATKAAVMAFQASKSLSQDGVAGPATQGALQNASAMAGGECDGSDDSSDDSVDLNGEAGAVSTYETMSQYANEQVGEGEEDSVVAGLRIEADNGSDIGITSIKLEFAQNTGADSTDLDDYVEEVTVWFDGEMVGSADADDFSEDSNDDWSKTISLDGVVIESDEEGEIEVAVTAVSNIDSGDLDSDAWTVDFQTVRFVDGQDVVTSEDAGTNAVSFDFGSFATAADIEMAVALSNDNMDARVMEVDATSDTDGVELLKFTIEADGSDIEINDLPVLLTVTGAADVDLVTNSLTLEVDGEEFTESVSTSTLTAATITFDDLNFTINDGDEVTFTVTADINDIESGSFDEGDTLKAELRSFETDAIDADDSQGDAISDTDATGTALGEEVAFYTTGIMVTDFTSDVVNYSTDTADTDTGEFTMTFTVEAFGGTVYVADTATVTTVSSIPDAVLTTGGVRYRLTDSGTATADDQASDVNFSEGDGADDSSNGQIALEEGESTTITITVTQTNNDADDDGIYRAYIQAILWNTTDATNLYNVYDFNLDDFETEAVSLN
jgi:hypothetical protein